MRIIGGEKKGMRLADVDVEGIRPTPGMVRESVFNILMHNIEGAQVLCPFAGTGSMGLEALSRGAGGCVFIENSRQSMAILSANIAKLNYEDRTRVLRADALKAGPQLERLAIRFDLVIIDPPYRMTADLNDDNEVVKYVRDLGTADYLAPGAIIVLDHPTKGRVSCSWNPLTVIDTRRYGAVSLIFLKKTDVGLPATESACPDGSPIAP